MANRKPFGVGEWYHCYNRGVDRRRVFQNRSDYERFLLLLFTANSSVPAHTFHLKNKDLRAVLADESLGRGTPLVEIGTYSLMPNHFHLVMKEIRDGGIALFMQKVFTGYTMYFNKKNDRTGALFAGTFKSKHVVDDEYLKQLIPYVLLNAVELFDPQWKTGQGSTAIVEKRLKEYPYSSLPDLLCVERLERKILGNSIFEIIDHPINPRKLLDEAKAYYLSLTTPNTEV